MNDMNNVIYIVFVAVLLYTGASKGQGNAELSASALNLDIEPYRSANFSSKSSLKRGFLEENEIAIGTILRSHHFDKYDYHDYQKFHTTKLCVTKYPVLRQ